MFQFKVSTSVLQQLQWGPRIKEIRSRQLSFLLRTDKELLPDQLFHKKARAVVFGSYKGGKVICDVELDGTIEDGQLETDMSVRQLDSLLYEWEEIYSNIPFLKKFGQKTKKLTFHEGEGFVYTCSLQREFNYLFLIDIGYEAADFKLQNRLLEIKDLPAFIKSMEGDARSRLILSNNKSGLPVYVAVQREGGEIIFKARHPMHDVVWSRRSGFKSYFYQDSIEDVKTLPEIKRLMADTSVKKFLTEQGAGVRVSAKGNMKEGFSLFLVGRDGVSKLGVKWTNKKLTLENSN